MMTKETLRGYSVEIAQLLSDKKAGNVRVIDVESVTPFFDFIIIASAESFVQINALGRYVKDKLDEFKMRRLHPLDLSVETPWLLIDCGDIVIHIFNEEARDFYNLEKLWAEGSLVEFESVKKDEAVI
ncbi:MAG: ribosome silencing factor [Spirochaetota bacterium]|nr:ribosome silencing factor [Spirochaetota bacterium]